METLIIPTEEDFKRWIIEAIEECFKKYSHAQGGNALQDEKVLSRNDVLKMYGISKNTLLSWMRNGLTSYRDRRRVYFRQSDLLKHLSQKKKKVTF